MRLVSTRSDRSVSEKVVVDDSVAGPKVIIQASPHNIGTRT